MAKNYETNGLYIMAKQIYELEMANDIQLNDDLDINNIMIVDGLNLAFRYKHANAESFADSYLRTVNSLAKSYGANKTIVLSDWGSSTYRLELYPEYKGDRKERIAKQSDEEQEAFLKFIEEFNNALDLCASQHLVLKYKGVEADDIAAYISFWYLKKFEHDVWLISSDKDWDLLLADNIHRFSYVTRKEYRLDNWHEYYPFPHEALLHVKAIQGGKDNVKGVAGIGEKRAWQLVDKYGDVFDIHSSLPIPGKSAYINNLNNFGDKLLLNLSLMDKISHCIQAIGKENIKDIDQKLEKYLCS